MSPTTERYAFCPVCRERVEEPLTDGVSGGAYCPICGNNANLIDVYGGQAYAGGRL